MCVRVHQTEASRLVDKHESVWVGWLLALWRTSPAKVLQLRMAETIISASTSLLSTHLYVFMADKLQR